MSLTGGDGVGSVFFARARSFAVVVVVVIVGAGGGGGGGLLNRAF